MSNVKQILAKTPAFLEAINYRGGVTDITFEKKRVRIEANSRRGFIRSIKRAGFKFAYKERIEDGTGGVRFYTHPRIKNATVELTAVVGQPETTVYLRRTK